MKTTIRLPIKMYMDATNSHPYTSSYRGNRIGSIQSKAIEKRNYTSSAQGVIKLFYGYF